MSEFAPPPGATDESPPEPEREPESEPEQADTPPPEPPPPAGPSEQEIEAAFKKLDRATGRYRSTVADTLGEEAGNLLDCPLCLPYARGFLHAADAGRVPPEVAQSVRQWLGDTIAIEYPESTTYRPCGACDALGKVRTGSRVPGHESLPCDSCVGYGYLPPPSYASNGKAPAVTVQPAPGPPAEPIVLSDVDPWGDPRLLPDGRENPNYGKMPQFKMSIEPWGVTAGLGHPVGA